MPLVRYFVFTSGLLLGLLFLLDWYLPASPATAAREAHDIDRSIIRIHSARKGPEAIQFDTSTPIVTTHPLAAEMPAVAAAGPADTPAADVLPQHVREASIAHGSKPRHALEAGRRHARLTRAASSRRERRFASYRALEWPGWSIASW
jgi:hypothetical protein